MVGGEYEGARLNGAECNMILVDGYDNKCRTRNVLQVEAFMSYAHLNGAIQFEL